MMTNHSTTRLTAALLCGVAALALSAMTGCRGDREDKPPRQFFPDMDDQPKWKPQSKTEFYEDGRTMRKPVAGTIGFSRVGPVSEEDWAAPWQQERADLLKGDSLVYEGTTPEGTYTDLIPVQVTNEMIGRGENRYNIFCAACHGYTGDGKGMVGQQWSYPLPNFHDPKYVDRSVLQGKDGYIFHVIRYGVAGANPGDPLKMPAYAHSIGVHDAWAIVSYIRTLQTAYAGSLDDVPDARRQELERARPTAPAPAAPAPAAPAPAAPATPAPSNGGAQ
jgi:mono/diheme cytochrome c family protein